MSKILSETAKNNLNHFKCLVYVVNVVKDNNRLLVR